MMICVSDYTIITTQSMSNTSTESEIESTSQSNSLLIAEIRAMRRELGAVKTKQLEFETASKVHFNVNTEQQQHAVVELEHDGSASDSHDFVRPTKYRRWFSPIGRA